MSPVLQRREHSINDFPETQRGEARTGGAPALGAWPEVEAISAIFPGQVTLVGSSSLVRTGRRNRYRASDFSVPEAP